MHFTICKEMGVKFDTEPWYERVPKSLETGPESKLNLLWN